MALNGAEPIDTASVEAFIEAGARHGLDSKSPFCVYGMAEATLAISFPEPGTGMTVDTVDRVALETEHYAAPAQRRPVPAASRSSGTRCAGSSCACATPTPARRLRDREVGELELRGDVGHARLLRAAPTSLPRASATGGCAPATSGTSSTARSSSAAASRT